MSAAALLIHPPGLSAPAKPVLAMITLFFFFFHFDISPLHIYRYRKEILWNGGSRYHDNWLAKSLLIPTRAFRTATNWLHEEGEIRWKKASEKKKKERKIRTELNSNEGDSWCRDAATADAGRFWIFEFSNDRLNERHKNSAADGINQPALVIIGTTCWNDR